MKGKLARTKTILTSRFIPSCSKKLLEELRKLNLHQRLERFAYLNGDSAGSVAKDVAGMSIFDDAFM